MRLPVGTSEHRAAFLLEEALRLVSLPGEAQGRAYYLRRVALRGLSAAAPPGEWTGRAQSALQTLAARAVHGADTRAAAAAAVFFNSHQEALEWLLRRTVRSSPRAPGATEWFAPMIAPMIAPADENSGAAMQAVAVVERLRSLPAGWFAAAAAVLETLETGSAAWPVLEAIPEGVLQAWLRELGGAAQDGPPAPPISAARRRILLGCLAGRPAPPLGPCPWNTDASAGVGPLPPHAASRRPLHLLWLAALAVVAEHPGELARGAAVAGARAVLAELAGPLPAPPLVPRKDLRDMPPPPPLAAPEAVRGPRRPAPGPLSPDSAMDAAPGPLPDNPTDADLDTRPEGRDRNAAAPPPDAGRSLFTPAGGLYFLLNALRRLGMEAAMEALPAELRGAFLTRLIAALAQEAEVAPGDPALLWAAAAPDAAPPDACLTCPAACWPRSFFTPPGSGLTPSRLVRAWTLAARRWCWRNARLTLREVVSRPARILLTRTDLDVTLSMNTVDLRLRRSGLDLDPGWLPWFGRVVRFHYVQEMPSYLREMPLHVQGLPLRGTQEGGPA